MAVKFLSDGHFSGSSTDLTLDGQLFLPSFSNTPGASPTISFDSGSGGISYRNGGGSSDQLWFRAGGSNMGYVNTAGIHSSGNLYTANAGDFRNYGGEWHATTGITGNGFKFTNTADSIDALTLSATGNATFAGDITIDGDTINTSNSDDYLEFDDDTTTFNPDTNVTTLASVSGIALATNLNDGGGGTFTVATGSTGTELLRINTNGNATFAGNLDVDGTGNNEFVGNIRISNAGPILVANSTNNASGFRINVTGLDGDNDDLLRIQDSGTTRVELHRNGTFQGLTSTSFIKSGGTSSQFLMADGSVSTGGSGITQADADTRYVNVTGDTMTGALEIGLSTNTSGSSTGTTFLELDNNVGNDISQQQSFIDFKFTDTNANFTPQVRIGAQVGPDADANAISKEGAGSFVVYTAPIGSDESGNSSGLAESFRVSYDGDVSIPNGSLTVSGNGTFTGNIEATSYIQSDNNFLAGGTLKFKNNAGNSFLNGFRRVSGTNNLELINISDINTSGGGAVTFAGDITVSGGDIILGGTGRIQGVDTVSAGTDAANKTYVDNAIAGITEQDTLDTVVERGSVTDNNITINGLRTNADSTHTIGTNGVRFQHGYFDNLHTKDKIQNNTAAYINYISNQGHRFYVDANNDENTHEFQILSNTSTYAAGNVVFTVDQSGNVISEGSISMNQSNTQVDMTGNTSGNFTLDNNTGSIAFQANGSTVNSMTITSSAITLNENTTVTGTFDPQGNILGAVVDDGNIANPLTVKRSAASTMQVGINFTVSPSSGSGFSRYLGVDSSADLRFGSSTNHATNALVLTTANYVSQFGSFAGDIIPSADSTYDLGSNANKWAEGHFDHLFVGETGNNPRIDIYTENGTTSIADTFADSSTDKSYIYFQAGTNSNDPGYIMHETSESASPNEQNEGVLHLVPSDDNASTDYVSIHGTNDPDAIRLYTNGFIQTANPYQLTLQSGSGDVYINDGLTVNGVIAATGGTSTTWNEAHDNMIISASVSGTSTKTLTLNQNDGGTITASWSDLQGTTVTAPSAPTNLNLSIVNNTVNVTFNASSTSNIDQYLVFGSANGGDYSLISVIEPASMSATMSVIDDSFDDSGAQAYRVYAMKTGVMSNALSGSITYTVTTPVEPTNMSVVNLNTAFYIQWDPPSSNARFVTAYNVYKHEHASQGSLSRSSATLIYSGMNKSYMYEISGNNNLNYHQFWVETTVT